MKRPPDATLLESDGTFWKCVDHQYYWWRNGWGWQPYVGKVTREFENKFLLVSNYDLTDEGKRFAKTGARTFTPAIARKR